MNLRKNENFIDEQKVCHTCSDDNEQESIREKDIRCLKELGFIIVYENEEKYTEYGNLCDANGAPLFDANSLKSEQHIHEDDSEGVYYKDTHFVHPKKSIYISLEHLFYKGGYNIRYDVSGYMTVKKDDCIKDIYNNTFWDWSIKVLDNNNFGIPIYRNNWQKCIEYLKNGKIVDLNQQLPSYYLTLEIEEHKNNALFIDNRHDCCQKIIDQMQTKFQKYFNNTEEVYQKRKKFKKY